MSKAREIAETRFAKGEITEEEFRVIIDSLEKSTVSQKTSSINTASNVTEQNTTGQAESAKTNNQRGAESTPEMLQHYQNASFMSDLTLPAKIIDRTVDIIILIYFFQMITLFRKSGDPSSFNSWFKVFSVNPADPLAALASLALFIPQLIVTVAGLVWVFRASKNLFFFRISSLNISPGWSVGWFFVPIAFFWMPIKVFHQLYASSKYGDNWKNTSIYGLIIVWWILFWIVELSTFLIPTDISSSDDTYKALIIYGVYLALSAASLSIFSKKMVNVITEKQELIFSKPPNQMDA